MVYFFIRLSYFLLMSDSWSSVHLFSLRFFPCSAYFNISADHPLTFLFFSFDLYLSLSPFLSGFPLLRFLSRSPFIFSQAYYSFSLSEKKFFGSALLLLLYKSNKLHLDVILIMAAFLFSSLSTLLSLSAAQPVHPACTAPPCVTAHGPESTYYPAYSYATQVAPVAPVAPAYAAPYAPAVTAPTPIAAVPAPFTTYATAFLRSPVAFSAPFLPRYAYNRAFAAAPLSVPGPAFAAPAYPTPAAYPAAPVLPASAFAAPFHPVSPDASAFAASTHPVAPVASAIASPIAGPYFSPTFSSIIVKNKKLWTTPCSIESTFCVFWLQLFWYWWSNFPWPLFVQMILKSPNVGTRALKNDQKKFKQSTWLTQGYTKNKFKTNENQQHNNLAKNLNTFEF